MEVSGTAVVPEGRSGATVAASTARNSTRRFWTARTSAALFRPPRPTVPEIASGVLRGVIGSVTASGTSVASIGLAERGAVVGVADVVGVAAVVEVVDVIGVVAVVGVGDAVGVVAVVEVGAATGAAGWRSFSRKPGGLYSQ